MARAHFLDAIESGEMKARTTYWMALLALQWFAFAAPVEAAQPHTIPALREWSDAQGSYVFGANARIVIDAASAESVSATASVFAADLLSLTGFTLPVLVDTVPQPGDITLALGANDSAIGEEGYLLTVADHISIQGRTDAGVFYGTRSVLQMLRQGFEIHAGSARDWPDYPERALMVDVGRKFFSLAFIERHVKELAYLKLNYLHLHLSDQWANGYGFRLESASHPEITSAGHYGKADIANLIALARTYHVTVVPEVDVPAHATALLAPHPTLALPGRPDKLDLSNPAGYVLVQDLLNEFLSLFPAPFWHTGGDEYLAPAEYASFPQLLTYAQQQYGPAAVAPDTYIGFVNWIDGIVKAHGKQLRAWDDVYGVTGTEAPKPDIVLEMWWPYILPQDALSKGHTIMNCQSATLYYVLGGYAGNPANLYEQWAPNRQWVASLDSYGNPASWIDLPASTPGLRGGKFHVWCDSPDAQTEEQVQDGIAPHLRGLAQNSWGSPRLVPSYSQFLAIIDPVGHTPDWGPDFALVASSTTASVTAGQTASLSLRLASISGFTQQVALTCAPVGSAPGVSCSVSPTPATPAAGTSVSAVTVSVATTAAQAAALGVPGAGPGRVRMAGFAAASLWLVLAFSLKRSGTKARAVQVICLAALVGGCGSSSGAGSTPTPTPTPIPGTPAGTYTLAVTAASGSLAHSISMSVTVVAPRGRRAGLSPRGASAPPATPFGRP
jgi:hexosaminidase